MQTELLCLKRYFKKINKNKLLWSRRYNKKINKLMNLKRL